MIWKFLWIDGGGDGNDDDLSVDRVLRVLDLTLALHFADSCSFGGLDVSGSGVWRGR